ncbi:MAG TPA: hypothetical protein VGF59_17875 [Bryobacteraceae bacterium]
MDREARRRGLSLSAALDLAAREWLEKSGGDARRQQRLQRAGAECFGVLASGNGRRSETVREIVRERLRRKH